MTDPTPSPFSDEELSASLDGEVTDEVRRAIEADPERKSYVDQALMPVTDADEENLELFTQNEAAKHAVQHAHRIDELTHRVA